MDHARPGSLHRAIRHLLSSAQSSWWIDDEGVWREVTNAANDVNNSDPFGSQYLRKIAFHQLGLVRLTLSEEETIISWNLTKASEKGLVSALNHLLHSMSVTPVRLCFFHGGWCTETFSGAHQALRRIIELRSRAGDIPEQGIYLREIDTGLLREASPLLQKSFDAWNQGKIKENRCPGLASNMQMFTMDPKTDDIVFDHVGRRTLITSLLGETWRRSARGRLVSEEHGDGEFENEVSRPYWQVYHDMEPYYDHVRALVFLQESDPSWLTYQRLILPITEEGGKSPKLAVFIQPTQNISIPMVNPTA